VQLPIEVRCAVEKLAGRIPASVLKRAVAAMTEHYRDRRSTASLGLSSEEKLAAYLVTRLPATYAAAFAVFREVSRRLGDVPMTSLLDLGAGAGATSLAAGAVFPALGRCTLIESDRAFAEVAAKLVAQAEVRVADVRLGGFPGPYDLVVAGYLLGELTEQERRVLLERAWRAARVALVVLEPGSSAGFALVRDLRDHLLGLGARMIAPCPGEASCPMPSGDWCHFGQRVERTSLHRRMKEGALGYEDEKFSYVALAKQEVRRAEARIIRRPEHSPGLVQLVLCAGDEVSAARITRRNPAVFRAARKAQWGEEWSPGMTLVGERTCS
jgi:ribosomal protein RSM22 (predicted rRNA methylase)